LPGHEIWNVVAGVLSDAAGDEPACPSGGGLATGGDDVSGAIGRTSNTASGVLYGWNFAAVAESQGL